MYRLVYVSRAREALTDRDIGEILDTSASNNFERYMTGFLGHNRGHFMQVLEGPEEEVREIYGRIEADQRHCCVIQIVGERIGARAFPHWSMNYHRIDDAHGHPTMVVRRGDVVEDLMPATAPREMLDLFSRFFSIR